MVACARVTTGILTSPILSCKGVVASALQKDKGEELFEPARLEGGPRIILGFATETELDVLGFGVELDASKIVALAADELNKRNRSCSLRLSCV